MNQVIYIPPSVLIGKTLSEQIADHNARVERIWLTVGSRCNPANAKRAAYGEAALSELQRPKQELRPSAGLRSDRCSPTSLTNNY
jgi:hypothetical protein